MVLEQITGSVQGYCCQLWPVHLYTERFQGEELVVPSMYFPPISVNDAPFTKDGYSKLYTVRVLCYHSSSTKALQEAERLADVIRSGGHYIPLYNEDGSESGAALYASRISTAVIDTGAAQITMILEMQTKYEE